MTKDSVGRAIHHLIWSAGFAFLAYWIIWEDHGLNTEAFMGHVWAFSKSHEEVLTILGVSFVATAPPLLPAPLCHIEPIQWLYSFVIAGIREFINRMFAKGSASSTSTETKPDGSVKKEQTSVSLPPQQALVIPNE